MYSLRAPRWWWGVGAAASSPSAAGGRRRASFPSGNSRRRPPRGARKDSAAAVGRWKVCLTRLGVAQASFPPAHPGLGRGGGLAAAFEGGRQGAPPPPTGRQRSTSGASCLRGLRAPETLRPALVCFVYGLGACRLCIQKLPQVQSAPSEFPATGRGETRFLFCERPRQIESYKIRDAASCSDHYQNVVF